MRNSQNTCRLSGLPIRNSIHNLQSEEPLSSLIWTISCLIFNDYLSFPILCPLKSFIYLSLYDRSGGGGGGGGHVTRYLFFFYSLLVYVQTTCISRRPSPGQNITSFHEGKIREVLQTGFRFDFRKRPRQISAGPGWSTPEEVEPNFLLCKPNFLFRFGSIPSRENRDVQGDYHRGVESFLLLDHYQAHRNRQQRGSQTERPF